MPAAVTARVNIHAVERALDLVGEWPDVGGGEYARITLPYAATLFLGEDQLRELRDECDRLLLVKAHMEIDREDEEMGWLDTAHEGLEAVSSSTPG